MEVHRKQVASSGQRAPKSYSPARPLPWRVGGKYRVLEQIPIRASSDDRSHVVCEIPAGAVVAVTETITFPDDHLGMCPYARVVVDECSAGHNGWVRCVSKEGYDLVDVRDQLEPAAVLERLHQLDQMATEAIRSKRDDPPTGTVLLFEGGSLSYFPANSNSTVTSPKLKPEDKRQDRPSVSPPAPPPDMQELHHSDHGSPASFQPPVAQLPSAWQPGQDDRMAEEHTRTEDYRYAQDACCVCQPSRVPVQVTTPKVRPLPPTLLASSGSGTPADAQTAAKLERWLTAVYSRYNPTRLLYVKELLERFKGHEAELITAIVQKYRVRPPPSLLAISPASAAYLDGTSTV